ncbi:MAG: hypothetical protein F2667_01785 [Actinobacteria bacterium]|uniref:Unannotated protein n=1 Tax=freshwater metagenome TaxID=449393 RepID=A0A6J6NZY4_9ZZZZ|nr:hypothetical protein [Actinomycetota bacterium]
MDRQHPRSVVAATGLLLLLVLLGGITAVLTGVLQDDLILNWAQGHRSAREILELQGLDYLKEEQPIAVPQFFPVASVLFVVVASLLGVLLAFFRGGHGWARLSLTGLVAMTAVATVSGIRVSPPLVFEVLSYVSIVVAVAVLVALWLPSTSAFLRAQD